MVQKKSKKKSPPPLTIRELTHKAEWLGMYVLIKQLNRRMSRKQFESLLIEMLARGYRCVGAYQGRKLVGAVGFWVSYRFWCGKYIDIDNVVVDEKIRSKGIGKKMVAWVEKEGRKQACEMSMLDCYTTSHAAHRFYFREGYSILGYHFTKDL